METLAFGVFAITGFWVWLCVALWVILSLTYIEKESGVGVFFIFLVFVVLFHLGGVFNVLLAVFSNPVTTVLSVLTYFVAGTLWTLTKFKLFVRRKRIEINAAIDEGAYDGRYGNSLESAIKHLSVQANRYSIMRWAIWWPFSLLWTIIRDVVRDIFDWILTEIIGRALESISAGEVAKIKKDRIKKKDSE